MSCFCIESGYCLKVQDSTKPFGRQAKTKTTKKFLTIKTKNGSDTFLAQGGLLNFNELNRRFYNETFNSATYTMYLVEWMFCSKWEIDLQLQYLKTDDRAFN